MRTYIKKLQSKEEDIRKQILAGALIVSMSLVALVWMYSLSDRFSSDTKVAQTDNSTKPFTLFANSVASTYNNIAASVGSFSFANKSEQPAQKQIDLMVVENPSVQ